MRCCPSRKSIVDRPVDGEKSLGVSWRLKAAHLTFALSSRLVRDFSAVVGVLLDAVRDGGEGGPLGCGRAAEFVDD